MDARERSAERFEIIAVTDFPEGYREDPRALKQIIRIANSGWRTGRHVLLEFRTDKELPRDVTLESFTPRLVVNCANPGFRPDDSPPREFTEELLKRCGADQNLVKRADWAAVVRPAKFFGENSTRKLETPIGDRLRFWLGKDVDGKEAAHAILAGQNGSGKSSFLHVLITGLATRYSPDELRFFLVDGKIELKAYETLPHAEIVCLDTSPAIALSVLEEFREEMKARLSQIEGAGRFDLIEYRQERPREVLPRLVMDVDEYKVLLQSDPVKAGELLRDVLERGRAAGTHLVLASQDLDVKMMPDEFRQHVHLRASLFLAHDKVQQITTFESEGKRLIRQLRTVGEVVINDESGRDGKNVPGAVAELRPVENRSSAVKNIVTEIAANARSDRTPILLKGKECAVLAGNPFVRQWSAGPPDGRTLEQTARLSVRKGGLGAETWIAGYRPIPLWLGRKFDVHGHAMAVLYRDLSQNLLSIGSNSVYRLSMLANALAALRSMIPVESLEILLLDGVHESLPAAGLLRTGLQLVAEAGAQVTRLGRDAAVGPAIEQFAAKGSDQTRTTSRLLILSEPEYFTELHGGGAPGKPLTAASRAFHELLKRGPQTGAHVIVTASSLIACGHMLHTKRDAAHFRHRVAQQMTQEESGTLFDSYVATHIQELANHATAALYVDNIQGARAGQLFKSYSACADMDGDQGAQALRESLRRIYPAAARHGLNS
jgi:hypothetical protein